MEREDTSPWLGFRLAAGEERHWKLTASVLRCGATMRKTQT
jgi:hypothetical protein